MRKDYVRPDGTLPLGPEAELAGYTCGKVVNILVTRAKSIIISFDEDPPPLDTTFRSLQGGQAQLALKGSRRRGR